MSQTELERTAEHTANRFARLLAQPVRLPMQSSMASESSSVLHCSAAMLPKNSWMTQSAPQRHLVLTVATTFR